MANRILSTLVVLALTFHLSVAVYTRYDTPHIKPINDLDNDYIFVFKENVTPVQKQNFLFGFAKASAFNKVNRHFEIDTFSGFVATATSSFVASATTHPYIKYIEKDGYVHAAAPKKNICYEQNNAVWGLNRIAERDLNLDGVYEYRTDGEGVTAYIIDTGIYVEHDEFEGRASWGATFTPDRRDVDCNGHGTHVAGTVGGKTYGVAKKVTLVAVKVLDCGGSGSWSGVIGGIEWVAAQHKKNGGPSTANMSLGGGKNKALDDAIRAMVNTGVITVVAAGNEDYDACQSSPANVDLAITVGSSTVDDHRSSFSNWGTCVDIFGPGSGIMSAWIDHKSSTRLLSGTSMASPHVCGATAIILAENNNATAAEVKSILTTLATPSTLDFKCRSSFNDCSKSPNLLVFSACDEE